MWSSRVGGEGWGSLSDADLVGTGCHSGEWPPMSLCGFDRDRDLCSSSVYGSGPLWQCLLRTAATSVSTSWEGGGYINGSLSSYSTSPTLSPPSCLLRDKQWLTDSVTVMHTLTTLIKHLPWRGKDVTAAGRISPGCLCQTIVCFKFIRSNVSLILEIIMKTSFMGQWECCKWKLNPRSCLFCGWMERNGNKQWTFHHTGHQRDIPYF